MVECPYLVRVPKVTLGKGYDFLFFDILHLDCPRYSKGYDFLFFDTLHLNCSQYSKGFLDLKTTPPGPRTSSSVAAHPLNTFINQQLY